MTHTDEILVVVAIFFVSVIPACLSQEDLTVCPQGCNYNSIQGAVNAAQAGDTLVVHGPAFRENLAVNNSLTVHGLISDGGRPLLETDNGTTAILSADGVTLFGFRFMNSRGPANSGDGGKDCSVLVVDSQENSFYLNDFADSRGICTSGWNSWNSSGAISYQYNSKIFSSRMGNYWGDYNGSDKDGDGIGDQPKVINADNVDYYPLMEPSESYGIKGEKLDVENVIDARLGQPFNITLDSNPTTGYVWTVDYDSRFLNKTEEGYVSSQAQLIGSGGQQFFTFTPVRTGKTTVSAVYKRPWENIAADERTFRIITSE